MTDRIRVEDGPLWRRLTLIRPVLEVATLKELTRLLHRFSRSPHPRPLILGSNHPTIFLAGAHLAEIADLDENTSVAYAAAGRQVMQSLRSHPRATIAAVNGSCSGGGFDLVLSCDRIVAGPSASFSHPGVRRGLVTGWGGTVSLPAAIGRSAAQRALLEAYDLTADDAEDLGLAIGVVHDVEASATELAERLAGLHGRRLAVWRHGRDRSPVRRWDPLASRAIIN